MKYPFQYLKNFSGQFFGRLPLCPMYGHSNASMNAYHSKDNTENIMVDEDGNRYFITESANPNMKHNIWYVQEGIDVYGTSDDLFGDGIMHIGYVDWENDFHYVAG